MNSRTFLKWISAWAAIVLAQGALLSANAATPIYPAPGQTSATMSENQKVTIDIGAPSANECLLEVAFDGMVTRSYNVYFYVRAYTTETGGDKVSPYAGDGLDGSQLNMYKHYRRIYRIPANVQWVKLETKDCVSAQNITVSKVSVEEAMAVYDEIWADVNTGSSGEDLLQTALTKHSISTCSIPADPFANLPKFKDALLNGTPCHIHLLGDSVISETWASSFETLIQNAYPNSKLKFTVGVGPNNPGCVYYKNYFGEYVDSDADVLVIGGICNFRTEQGTLDERKTALRSVVGQARSRAEKPMEVLYLSTQRGCDSRGMTAYGYLWPETPTQFEALPVKWYEEVSPMEWKCEDDVWAEGAYFYDAMTEALEGTGAQCWDVFPQYQEFVYQSGRPYGWFNRDPGGTNARGRELLSRVLFEYVKAGVPVPSGDSNEDAAASTNLVGVTRVKVPAKLNEKVLIAVPWVNGVTADGDIPVSVSNLVKTANLRENDQLWWYDSVNSKYMVWEINAQTNWTEVTTVTKGDEFEEDKFEAARAPDSKLLARGDAVLLWRVNSEDWSKPVYLSGMDTDSPVTFTFGKNAGLSLFAPPSVSNLAGVDFTTAATWTGLSTGDKVMFVNANGALMSFTWKNNKWNGIGSKVIPIGIGAWFKRAADGTEDVTVTFPDASSAN